MDSPETVPNRIACPSCQKPLNVPVEAVGQPVHCPFCQASFAVSTDADGKLITPEISQRFAIIGGVPRLLAAPGIALLSVCFAGLILNGVMTIELSTRPGADRELARKWVQELQSPGELEELREAAKRKKDDPNPQEKIPTRVEEQQADAIAAVWAPLMLPIHAGSLALSAIATLGAMCILAGRFYWFAMFGCVVAAINLNYLCCVPGAIAGLWAFLSLTRDESQVYFRRAKADRTP